MPRYGAQYGPDVTFLGVDRCDLSDPASFAGADVVVLGRPVRRRHLPPARRPVRPAGDPDDRLPAARRVPAQPGAAHRRPARPAGPRRRGRRDVLRRHRDGAARAGGRGRDGRPGRRDPGGARRRPLHRVRRREGRRQRPGPRPGVDAALRCPRRHRRHRVRLAVGPRPADAPADRVRGAARRPLPADRPARLLAAAGDAGLDGRAADALLRDERDRLARARRLPHRGVRHRRRRVRGRLPVRRHRRLRPRARPRHRHARAGRADRAGAAGLRAAHLPGAPGRGHGRRRGQPAVRPRRHHRGAGQPRRPRGAVRDRPPPAEPGRTTSRRSRDPLPGLGPVLPLLADRPTHAGRPPT